MSTVTHALRYNGAAFDAAGKLINSDPKVTGGKGRASCNCGQLSEELPSGGARRRWYADHKLEVGGEEDLLGDATDEMAELLGTDEPHHEVDQEMTMTMPVLTDERDTSNFGESLHIPFTTSVAKHFWRSLGRRAVRKLIHTMYPELVFTPDNKERVVILDGPEELTVEAGEKVLDMWTAATSAFITWQKTDPEYLDLPKEGLEGRNASFALKEKFFGEFAAQYVDELQAARR